MRHGLPIVEVQIPKHVLEIGLFEEKYNLCASCNDGFALTILEHNVVVLKGGCDIERSPRYIFRGSRGFVRCF